MGLSFTTNGIGKRTIKIFGEIFMNIADIQFPIFKPYNKSAIEIYVSGCTGKCEQCHNSQLWDFNYGNLLTYKTIEWLKKRHDFFDVISILGGDLLDQVQEEAIQFTLDIKEELPNKELWLFTGYNRAEVTLYSDWVFELFDFIKVGRYMPKLETNSFPASTNQKLLKKGVDY